MSFLSKEEKFLGKNRKPLTSSTNTRDSLSRKQKSYSKTDNTSILPNEYLMNRSIGERQKKEGEEISRFKEAFSEKYHEKYHKKQKREQFPNISIIEQKESIMSINQENSLDSLNNFIIQGNKKQSFVRQISNESSSYDESGIQDWTLLQNDYIDCINHNTQQIQEVQYLNIVKKLKFKQPKDNQHQQQTNSLTLNVTKKIRSLQNEISKLKIQNQKKSANSESSEVLDKIGASQSYNQQKSLTFNEKSLELKASNEILIKSQTALQKQQQIRFNISKLKIRVSEDSNKKNHTSDRLLEHLEEQQNKEYIQQQSPSANLEETEKDQEQFMKYMDKKELQENQPNLSLNNISKIMGVRPKELHNKSIQNQNEIKEKEDDQVVAMLENQLRGKQIVIIPETEQTQILLKASQENLCLNELEGDIQNNLQTSQIQEQISDQNKKNFFIALQAREKWVKSLQKDENWKSAQLALLSKMKKILHNPYIEFPQY